MRLSSQHRVGYFDKNNKPAIFCKDGDTITLETNDCFDYTIDYDGTINQDEPFMHNPATGPVFVEGAMPGDVLCVEILSLKTNSYGIVGTTFGAGGFSHVKEPFSAGVFDRKGDVLLFHGKELPVNPMIGGIGVAPKGEGIITISLGHHGGNLDCKQVKEGAKVYFPVFTEGALFALGDIHIVMADGEVAGYGVEAGGEVTVKFTVIKGESIQNPVVFVDNKVCVLASAETLDEAADMAVEDMHKLLVRGGWSDCEAGMLMSLKCDMVINQMVNPLKTVRAEIDSNLIKKA